VTLRLVASYDVNLAKNKFYEHEISCKHFEGTAFKQRLTSFQWYKINAVAFTFYPATTVFAQTNVTEGTSPAENHYANPYYTLMEKNTDAVYTNDADGVNRIKLNPRTRTHMPTRVWKQYVNRLKPTANLNEGVTTTARLPFNPPTSTNDRTAVLGKAYLASSGFADATTVYPNVLVGTLRVRYYVTLINMQNEYLD